MAITSVFKTAKDALNALPGIGHKSSERIMFYLLSQEKEKTLHLANAIAELAKKTSRCNECGLISQYNPCRICSSPSRDQGMVCVVVSVQDALILERSGSYNGLYHVLQKMYDDVGEDDILPVPIKKLLTRLKSGKHTELLFALESGARGENTLNYVMQAVKEQGFSKVKFSKMAIGVPLGAGLEHIDDDTIRQSINHRYEV